ncbi:MAG TPA: amidohydrolase [Candidatus Limnocylindrales bacterium]|nr:amidohydrolase [Candidatus Limnocylindrales bacterium]
MSRPADLIIRGSVVVAAGPAGLEVAEAIAIANGRVVAVGRRDEIAVPAGARVIETGDAAVIPGIHDFHIHLVGLARAGRQVLLDDAADAGEMAARVSAAAALTGPGAWIGGRGWKDTALAGRTERLEAAVGNRPAFLMSHDGHSAWASADARRRAGVGRSTPDPTGGRIERDLNGDPTGILRERALDLVAPLVERLQGDELVAPLEATLAELAGLGITGASEAGDYTDENGVGTDAALGDSYSSLTDLGDVVDGRLRLSIGIPADAIAAAAARGLRSGDALDGRRTMRFGWAKQYTDGALGSGTAALFTADGDAGVMRISSERLDSDIAAARSAGIGMAMHAIGDRAVAFVLDALERAEPRGPGVPRDRIEHAQLLRPTDAGRFGRLGVIASIQPIHAAADRDLVEAGWRGREEDAYAWRSLASAGALLAAGSDAPVESANPWLGIFAAVHRRVPADPRADWRPIQAIAVEEALAAYTLAPAQAIGASDEGHLRVGARADLAVLTVSLEALLRADGALAEARSDLTIVDGREVHRS